MQKQFLRSAMLIGEENQNKLMAKRVAVFGLGGVGGYVVEALVRGGIGTLELIDGDVVSITNLNRQLLALHSTVGKGKAELAAERARDINPDICVTARKIFFDGSTAEQFDFTAYDYVVDAVDTVSAKLLIIDGCKRAGTPVISCLGTGNKYDAAAFEVSDITKTSVCPLAKVMRRELKKLGIEHLKVVYSKEQPAKSVVEDCGRHAPGSLSFVPPVAGFILAGEVIKDLLK